MKTLKDYQKEFIGNCYKNYKEFDRKTRNVCYIPENAECIEDGYNYWELLGEVNNWCSNNVEYVKDNNIIAEDLVRNMFDCLTWEFPTTWLEGLDNE